MRAPYRILAIVTCATAATVAMAQTSNPSSRRGGDIFHYGGMTSSPREADGVTSSSGIGRPAPRSFQAAVTPVPEPSEWAMMLAGLALVGFIVRRNARR